MPKARGECFVQDVVRAVHICVQGVPILGPVQSALHALAAEDVLAFLLRVVGGDGIPVKEAGPARVTLFLQNEANASQLCLVCQVG